MPSPDFFIVGAPKCGTTALFTYLQEHPQLHLPKKEFHHFGRDLRPAAYVGRKWDRSAYLALFDGAEAGQRVGEASVWYLYSQDAAREIKAFAPEADIIIMLRNPVEMMYSLYGLFCWVRDLTPNGVIDAETKRVLSFDEALGNQDDRKAAFLSTADREALAGKRVLRLFHTDAACYAAQVQRYLDVFAPEHLHVIVYDDFKADTAAAYRDTLRFLGVDPAYEAEFRVVNSHRHIRNMRLHRLLNTHNSMGWVRKVGRVVVPTGLRKRVFRTLHRTNVQPQTRPPMNPETRRWLQDLFRPDVERLSTLVGRDLTALWLDVPEPSTPSS